MIIKSFFFPEAMAVVVILPKLPPDLQLKEPQILERTLHEWPK